MEFVSVKHKEANQNAWTLAQLLRENVLADLYQVWVGMRRRGCVTFESDAGVATEWASFLRQPTAARGGGGQDTGWPRCQERL